MNFLLFHPLTQPHSLLYQCLLEHSVTIVVSCLSVSLQYKATQWRQWWSPEAQRSLEFSCKGTRDMVWRVKRKAVLSVFEEEGVGVGGGIFYVLCKCPSCLEPCLPESSDLFNLTPSGHILTLQSCCPAILASLHERGPIALFLGETSNSWICWSFS